MASDTKVLDRLRLATQESHRRLESQLDVLNRLGSPSERPNLVLQYRRMYSGAEHLRAGCLPGPRPGGMRHEVELHGKMEALGFRYVIEGSALGGRIILRRLEAQGVDTDGLDFLNPHGERTGAVWRSLLATLEREVGADPAALDQVVAGAVKGFAYAGACLRGPEHAA